jgi:Domain of unknown function (DUF6378)
LLDRCAESDTSIFRRLMLQGTCGINFPNGKRYLQRTWTVRMDLIHPHLAAIMTGVIYPKRISICIWRLIGTLRQSKHATQFTCWMAGNNPEARWLGLDIHYQTTSQVASDEDVLEEALRITRGDRNAQYGQPDQDFKRTAAMWSAMKGVEFEAREVAMFMVALKLSRETHQKKRDNWVDIAGYARCGSLCR